MCNFVYDVFIAFCCNIVKDLCFVRGKPEVNECGIITDIERIKTFINQGVPEDKRDDDFQRSFRDWKYHLHLGREVYISTNDCPKQLKRGEYIVIKPGDFVLLITRETIKLPKDVMAFISMRFDYKQKGLINVSGFHVDPLYNGKLIFSAFNAGPKDIVLKENDAVFMIFFQGINMCEYGKVDKHNDKNNRFTSLPSDMIESIRGTSTTLSSNANRLDKLEFYIKIIGGIVVTTTLSIIVRLILKN